MLNINMSLFSILSNIENFSFSPAALLTVTEAVWRFRPANCDMPFALIFKTFLRYQIKDIDTDTYD